MSNKSNVIDLNKFRAAQKKAKANGAKEEAHYQAARGLSPSKKTPPAPISNVIDMSERRQEVQDSDRRAVTRTVLSQFMGVFVILPDHGLQPVSLFDISESGLAFDLPTNLGSYDMGENVTMRIYLSHDTYFSFGVKIANKRTFGDNTRHGAGFRKADHSFKTLFYFTKFLESVSTVAKKDKGDRLVGHAD